MDDTKTRRFEDVTGPDRYQWLDGGSARYEMAETTIRFIGRRAADGADPRWARLAGAPCIEATVDSGVMGVGVSLPGGPGSIDRSRDAAWRALAAARCAGHDEDMLTGEVGEFLVRTIKRKPGGLRLNSTDVSVGRMRRRARPAMFVSFGHEVPFASIPRTEAGILAAAGVAYSVAGTTAVVGVHRVHPGTYIPGLALRALAERSEEELAAVIDALTPEVRALLPGTGPSVSASLYWINEPDPGAAFRRADSRDHGEGEPA